MGIKVDHVIRFVAVAEHLSFTKAARSLRVDQPWLSQQIRQLEDLLGAPLFMRDARPLRLTSTGERLLSAARVLADAAEFTGREIENIRRDYARNINLGVLPFSYSLKERADLYNEYHQKNPQIGFNFHVGHTSSLIDKIHSLETDAAIVLAPFAERKLDKILMRRCFAYLSIPVESDLARIDSLSINNLRGHRLAVLPSISRTPTWDAIYRPLENLGVELVEIPEGNREALNYYSRLYRMCAVTWDWCDEDIETSEDMICRSCADWKPYRDVYLVKLAKSTNPTIRQFWNMARLKFSSVPLVRDNGKAAA